MKRSTFFLSVFLGALLLGLLATKPGLAHSKCIEEAQLEYRIRVTSCPNSACIAEAQQIYREQIRACQAKPDENDYQ